MPAPDKIRQLADQQLGFPRIVPIDPPSQARRTDDLLQQLVTEIKGLRNDLKMRDLRGGEFPMSIQFFQHWSYRK